MLCVQSPASVTIPQVNKGVKDGFGLQFLFTVPWPYYFREVAAHAHVWQEYVLAEAAYLTTVGQQSGRGEKRPRWCSSPPHPSQLPNFLLVGPTSTISQPQASGYNPSACGSLGV